MKRLIHFRFFVFLLISLAACNAQVNSNPPKQAQGNPASSVGGGCDGCEIMFVGMPANIAAVDTSSGWAETGQKLLVRGKVFKIDGRSPAPGVIIYYWQTDNEGYYSPAKGLEKEAQRHGHIRGWVKTDNAGNYAIYSSRPAPYPNDNIPAHIHIAIKEPAIDDAYYIDDLVFHDDTLLTTKIKKAAENRGGTGILNVVVSGEMQVANHNIILGRNISGYPAELQ